VEQLLGSAQPTADRNQRPSSVTAIRPTNLAGRRAGSAHLDHGAQTPTCSAATAIPWQAGRLAAAQAESVPVPGVFRITAAIAPFSSPGLSCSMSSHQRFGNAVKSLRARNKITESQRGGGAQAECGRAPARSRWSLEVIKVFIEDVRQAGGGAPRCVAAV